MGLHQVKQLCIAKGTIIRVIGQPSEWKTIFGSYSSDKGFMSITHKRAQKIKQ
jgi:hypothetical protein